MPSHDFDTKPVTIETWIKVSSYPASYGTIYSKMGADDLLINPKVLQGYLSLPRSDLKLSSADIDKINDCIKK